MLQFLRVAPRLPPGILFSLMEDSTLSDADSFSVGRLKASCKQEPDREKGTPVC